MKTVRIAVMVATVSCAWLASAEPVDYVLTEMGTLNAVFAKCDCKVSNGNLYPVAMRPWGAGGWAPQTRPDGVSRWFYNYTDERLYGIRHTHQPSPWIGDYGAWCFLPVAGSISEDPKERASWYSHKAETCKPHLYRVYLADFDITVEITPSVHGAVSRITYAETDSPGVVVNPMKDGIVRQTDDGREIAGVATSMFNRGNCGVPVRQYFVMRFDRAAASVRKLADGAVCARFAPMKRGEQLVARMASSFISEEQARENLKEVAERSFDDVLKETKDEWNNRLGRIKVDSNDLDRLRTFYTCFFRTMLFPMAHWERAADGSAVHWNPMDGKVYPGRYYAGTGFWDTFRALFPLLNLLFPEENAKMMEGLERCWKECGWLPEWSAPGLTDCMIGNNSASVIADAWLSGVRGDFNIDELWKALVHGANDCHPKKRAVGRLGFEHYNRCGYVPRDVGIHESAARTLEYAYDDWCMAKLGAAIGRPVQEVELYRKRSANWRNVFDPQRKIACGRNADGSFNPNFNRYAWGGDFTEGCANHYTWSVFHDVEGLREAMGGSKEFERRLDEIFTLPPTAEYSYYKQVIHEIREMQIMNFGQYAHGNQPIQHMVYLYDWTDSPEKAGRWARAVMDRLYRPTPDGYCGDEDNGQTSAWYVWSAMGMYPLCPASGEYATGCPLFDRITVALPSGKELTITAPGASAGGFPKAPARFIRKSEIEKGAEVVYGR